MKKYEFEGRVSSNRMNRDFGSFTNTTKDYCDIPIVPTSTIETIMTPGKDWPVTVTVEVDGMLRLGAMAKVTIEVED